MPPKAVLKSSNVASPAAVAEEQEESETHNVKLWSAEFQQLCLFIFGLGTRVEIDIDGRKTDLFTIEGYNCRGMKYVVQTWGIDAFAIEEYFK
jgi:hypothetical protein